MEQAKVCVLTSVHPAFDTRVFHKQATSLADAGFDVTLIAQHNANEQTGGVKVIGLTRPETRMRRLLGLRSVLRLARDQNAKIYHLHDPELLLIAPFLKRSTGAKIIYDIHENIHLQILTKGWIPRPLRPFLSFAYRLVEKVMLHFVDALIVAEDSYKQNYKNAPRLACVHNYPVLSEVQSEIAAGNERGRFIYVGGISENRGALIVLDAFVRLVQQGKDFDLVLVGSFESEKLHQRVKKIISDNGIEDRVLLTGRLPYERAQEMVREADVGLIVLKPIPNYIESFPTKLFEYMAAGLPAIASDFPLWRKIVADSQCGLLVDPSDAASVANAMGRMLDNREAARVMGNNGRLAVRVSFSWETEKALLLKVYGQLVSPG